jgi:hypothetical protein
MGIDIEKLREDIKQDCYGAYFGGGFGGALMEAFDVDKASPQKLIEFAENRGIDLRNYKKGDERKLTVNALQEFSE